MLVRPLSTLALATFFAFSACQRTPSQPDGAEHANTLPTGPRAAVAAPNHDFGRVAEGEKLRHVFPVKNTGDAPLVIDSVSTSCGCTAAVIKEKQVPPGGVTEIEVTFNTTHRRGKNHKVITVLTNDATTPRTQLEIHAEVVPQLDFDPYTVRLAGEQATPTTTTVWLVGTLAPAAKPVLEDVTGGDGAVTAELVEERVADGVKRGVRLTLKSKTVARGRGVVHVATGVAERPKLELRFSYEATGNLKVPEQLFLDPSRESLRERTIEVTSKVPGFVLREARVEEGPFHATVTKAGDGFEVRVTAVPPPERKGVMRGRLVLVSNDPLEPRKEIGLSLAQPDRRGAAPTPSVGRAPLGPARPPVIAK